MEKRKLVAALMEGLPQFRDGRVDFTGAKTSPIISVVVYYDGKILILRRSSHVKRHKGLWSNVSGYIDRPDTPLEEFARAELKEEAGIHDHHLKHIKIAEPYEIHDAQREKRSWLVYPTLAVLSEKPEITLNWEHTDFLWIKPEQLKEYPRPSRLHLSIETALQFLKSK